MSNVQSNNYKVQKTTDVRQSNNYNKGVTMRLSDETRTMRDLVSKACDVTTDELESIKNALLVENLYRLRSSTIDIKFHHHSYAKLKTYADSIISKFNITEVTTMNEVQHKEATKHLLALAKILGVEIVTEIKEVSKEVSKVKPQPLSVVKFWSQPPKLERPIDVILQSKASTLPDVWEEEYRTIKLWVAELNSVLEKYIKSPTLIDAFSPLVAPNALSKYLSMRTGVSINIAEIPLEELDKILSKMDTYLAKDGGGVLPTVPQGKLKFALGSTYTTIFDDANQFETI